MFYFLAFLLAFLLVIFLTYFVRRLAIKYNVLDFPFLSRKVHKKNTPLWGGAAVYFGFFVVIIIFFLFTDKLANSYMLPKHLVGILLGGLFLVIGGMFDDKYHLKPWQQFVWPVLSALAIIVSGIGIEYISNPLGNALQLDQFRIKLFEIGGTPYYFVILADIFTFVWILGMIYTTKFLDGLDGLVSGISVITAFIIFFLSLKPELTQLPTAMLAIIFAGAVAGFLLWNFNPAKIFLGEAGSTLCGFMLGALAIISGGKIATALLCMGVPILDALWVIIRRIFAHRSPFFGDKKHLHFRLLDIGFSHWQAVVFLWFLSAGFGATALFVQGRQKLTALAILGGIMIVLAGLSALVYKYKKKA